MTIASTQARTEDEGAVEEVSIAALVRLLGVDMVITITPEVISHMA